MRKIFLLVPTFFSLTVFAGTSGSGFIAFSQVNYLGVIGDREDDPFVVEGINAVDSRLTRVTVLAVLEHKACLNLVTTALSNPGTLQLELYGHWNFPVKDAFNISGNRSRPGCAIRRATPKK